MKINLLSVRSLVMMALLLVVASFGGGCATSPGHAFYQALHQPRFETLPGRVTPFAVPIVNNTTNDLVVTSHFSQEVLTIVPPHETRTVFTHLEYYEQYFKVTLFVKPLYGTMLGKFIPNKTVVFQNYRYDAVYGSGWGTPQNEVYVWTITDETFKYRSW